MATTAQEAARADADVHREGNAAAAAANRRNGAHAVLLAATALVGLPAACGKVRAIALLLLLLLGCAKVLLSMGGRRRRHRRTAVALPAAAARAAPRVDRSPARLRWTGFHALLLLAGSPILLAPTYWPAAGAAAAGAEPRPQRQLAQVLGAYAVFVAGAALVLASTSYDGVPRSVRPAADAAARGLDGLLFAGSFAPASDASD
ncbi:uncharacterized protein LOC127782917 [Oryza glaberrima]|uniref:Uncharacterized protein n=1 Tax=Oryza nivara TaxID=4536 RepID=A0A0E0I894_ORYNI|nr:uncharacterized protein LOC127782917 [Oryza glaberrima]